MATITVVEEPKISDSAPQPKSDGESESSKAVEMGMAAQFGAMTETNRQLQEKLSALELRYAEAERSGEATRAELRAMETRINDLTAALEEEDQEVELVAPPKPEEPPESKEKPKARRKLHHKILFG